MNYWVNNDVRLQETCNKAHKCYIMFSLFLSKYCLPLPEDDVKQVHQVNDVSTVASSVRNTMPRPSFQSLKPRPRAAEKGSNNHFYKRATQKPEGYALAEASGLC